MKRRGNPRLVVLLVSPLLLLCLLALIWCWRRLSLPLSVYATLLLLISIWSSAEFIPLQAFDRYVLVIFPLWIVVADWLSRRRLLYPVLVLSAFCLCFYAVEFGRWAAIG